MCFAEMAFRLRISTFILWTLSVSTIRVLYFSQIADRALTVSARIKIDVI